MTFAMCLNCRLFARVNAVSLYPDHYVAQMHKNMACQVPDFAAEFNLASAAAGSWLDQMTGGSAGAVAEVARRGAG